ncbi:MAG TPA: hypothetical protein VFZ66_15195 [Herpetosiphonaceae bacterium]
MLDRVCLNDRVLLRAGLAICALVYNRCSEPKSERSKEIRIDHSEPQSDQNEQQPKKRTVFAPQPDNAAPAPAVISVELDEDEDVQWQWTHYSGGRSAVTGYTIVKKTEQPEHTSES